MSHCGTTVIRQGPQERVGAIEIPCTREGTRGVTGEIMPERSNASCAIAGGSRRRISADDGVPQRHGAPKVPDAAAIVGRGIIGNRRVRDNHGTEPVEDAAAIQRSISTNGAVRDGRRQVEIVYTAAAPYRAV